MHDQSLWDFHATALHFEGHEHFIKKRNTYILKPFVIPDIIYNTALIRQEKHVIQHAAHEAQSDTCNVWAAMLPSSIRVNQGISSRVSQIADAQAVKHSATHITKGVLYRTQESLD